jgi:hypothetical protein
VIPLLALITLVFVGHPASSLHATAIPLLLPRVYRPGIPNRIYARVEELQKHSYAVEFDFTADCGGDPCYIATIEGGVEDPPSGDSTVTLNNGIVAKYKRFTCGAWCGPSTLMFRYRGATYRLTLKGGSPADIVTSANSLFPAR